MLAYCVEWHMREAWREMTFQDEEKELKETRDPVTPAKRSTSADRKASTKTIKDMLPVHDFRTLLNEPSTMAGNACRPNLPNLTQDKEACLSFIVAAQPNALRLKALTLMRNLKGAH
jgi:hypothetical protein